MSDPFIEIHTASVKIMRSHDYCHFEIALSSTSLNGESLTTHTVDALRKEAARLADKAVEQYKIAKSSASKATFNGGEKLARLRKLGDMIQETAEHDRTPEEKAILKALADSNYEDRRYDYQDDWDDSVPY